MSIKRQVQRSLTKNKFQDRIIQSGNKTIIQKKSKDFKDAHNKAIKKYITKVK